MTDTNPRQPRTRLEIVLDFLADIRWLWGPFVVVFALALLAGLVPMPFDMSASVRTVIASCIVGMLVGYLPAKKLLALMYTPQMDTLVTLNAADPERPVDAYRVHPQTMKEDVEVTEGQLKTWRGATGTVHLARTFDPDTLEATGTWLGEISDMELLDARDNIEAQRLRNNKAAQAGIIALARIDSIEDQVKAAYFQNLVQDGMRFTAYDEDALLDPVHEQIPALDTDDGEESRDELHELIKDKLGSDIDGLDTDDDEEGAH